MTKEFFRRLERIEQKRGKGAFKLCVIEVLADGQEVVLSGEPGAESTMTIRLNRFADSDQVVEQPEPLEESTEDLIRKQILELKNAGQSRQDVTAIVEEAGGAGSRGSIAGIIDEVFGTIEL